MFAGDGRPAPIWTTGLRTSKFAVVDVVLVGSGLMRESVEEGATKRQAKAAKSYKWQTAGAADTVA